MKGGPGQISDASHGAEEIDEAKARAPSFQLFSLRSRGRPLAQKAGGRDLPPRHSKGEVIETKNGQPLSSKGCMDEFGKTCGSEIPISLIGEDDLPGELP
jgi:hypothetical protein